MAKLTNAQLVINLEASHVSYQALRAQYETLTAECDTLRAHNVRLINEARAHQARKPAYVAPSNPARDAAHAAFVAKCAAARQAAMSGGRSVLVE